MRKDPAEDPYPGNYEERRHTIEKVRAQILQSEIIPSILRPGLADNAESFVETVLKPHSRNQNPYGGTLGSTHWVIQNEHLDLIAVLSPTALSIATAISAATGGSPVVPAITALVAVGALARKFGSKAIILRREDYAVLMALKQMGPSTSDDVSKALIAKPPKGLEKANWSAVEIANMLSHLQSVPARDGTIAKLTNSLVNGLWTANGI